MQHGLWSTADQWVFNDADKAAASRLARHGYDVWFGNNRGNKYSMTHETLDPLSKEYFSYSFQEHGKYDVPAMIDKALEVSGKRKLSYVGHSQGNTQMFYALATNQQELASKVNLFVALAPTVKFNYQKHALEFGPLLKLFGDDLLRMILKEMKLYAITKEDVLHKLNRIIPGFDLGKFMSYLFDAVIGSPIYDSQEWLKQLAALQGFKASTQQLLHYAQIMQSKRFEHFDFKNASKNM